MNNVVELKELKRQLILHKTHTSLIEIINNNNDIFCFKKWNKKYINKLNDDDIYKLLYLISINDELILPKYLVKNKNIYCGYLQQVLINTSSFEDIKFKRLPIDTKIKYLNNIARLIDIAVNNYGILHTDLKFENLIMINDSNYSNIIDYDDCILLDQKIIPYHINNLAFMYISLFGINKYLSRYLFNYYCFKNLNNYKCLSEVRENIFCNNFGIFNQNTEAREICKNLTFNKNNNIDIPYIVNTFK